MKYILYPLFWFCEKLENVVGKHLKAWREGR